MMKPQGYLPILFTLALLALCCGAALGAEDQPASPISMVIEVEAIQPAGVTPACTVRAGYASTQGAIAAAQLAVDGVDVTACAEIYQEGIVYEHPLELAEGTHTVTILATDEAGNSATGSSEFVVAPYAGRQGLKFGVTLTGDLNAAALVDSISDELLNTTVNPSSDVDSSVAVTAAASLAGQVSDTAMIDIGADLGVSSNSVTLSDLHAGVGNDDLQANLGRYTVDYGEFTVQGMSARSTLLVGPSMGAAVRSAPAGRQWEAFALRTDSGVSGGLGAMDRYDRYAYGGRYAFGFGKTAASLSAARVWDSSSHGLAPGTYAPPQESTSLGLIVSSALGGEPGRADLAGELAWSDFEGDSATGMEGGSGLAYNLQLSGGDPQFTWSARAFDIPVDYYTLGNPFLKTGHDGVEVGAATTLGNGITGRLSYSDRTEQFLLGGLTGMTGVPASDVSDWTFNANWGDGVTRPAIIVSGSWADRCNTALGTDQIDQSERTLMLGLTKSWGSTWANATISDYSLSDAADGTAAVETRQYAASARHAIGKYILGANYSRHTNDLGTPVRVRSRLAGISVSGPCFCDELEMTASYLHARNSDSLGTLDATDEEYRFGLRYLPVHARSTWQRLLASLSLEARILYREDPTRQVGRLRNSEIWLVSGTEF